MKTTLAAALLVLAGGAIPVRGQADAKARDGEPARPARPGWRVVEVLVTNRLTEKNLTITLAPGQCFVLVGIEMDPALRNANTLGETSFEVKTSQRSRLSILSFRKGKDETDAAHLVLLWDFGWAHPNIKSISLRQREQTDWLALKPISLGAKALEPPPMPVKPAVVKKALPEAPPAKQLSSDEKAAALLQAVKDLAAAGSIDAAIVKCEYLIRDYAGTKSAAAAPALLASLRQQAQIKKSAGGKR